VVIVLSNALFALRTSASDKSTKNWTLIK